MTVAQMVYLVLAWHFKLRGSSGNAGSFYMPMRWLLCFSGLFSCLGCLVGVARHYFQFETSICLVSKLSSMYRYQLGSECT